MYILTKLDQQNDKYNYNAIKNPNESNNLIDSVSPQSMNHKASPFVR